MAIKPEDFGSSRELHRQAFHPDKPTCIWCEPGSTAMLPEDRVFADNERLRALIKAAEWADQQRGDPWCPWCKANGVTDKKHRADCPTFTPEGEVR